MFSDQYVCSQPGKHYNHKGQELHNQAYNGGTIFYDCATGFIHLANQVGFTAEETVTSKLDFERGASHLGILVKEYRTDNGIYASKTFGESLAHFNQKISFSGVGGHHHNGAAEATIGSVTRRARTIMFHASLLWPDVDYTVLWPLALQHAVYLHNHTPSSKTCLSPIELWTQSKNSLSGITNAHPWGCPVYVLQPKLQNGQKIPRWDPRSRRGQYLGVSPHHASSVGLVKI